MSGINVIFIKFLQQSILIELNKYDNNSSRFTVLTVIYKKLKMELLVLPKTNT